MTPPARRRAGAPWAGRPLLLLVLAALLLTGCTESSSVVRSDAPASSPADDAPDVPNPDLTAAKAAAGIPDCPTTDATATPVAGGLPDLVLECLGGGRSVHLAGLRGRPLVVNVWAQWCEPCRAEAPALAALAGSRSVAVLGVDHDDPQPDLAVEFAGQMRWTYPQVYDPGRELGQALQVAGIPQTFLVRADGTIAYRNTVPFTSADQLRALVRTHLGVEP